MTDVRQLTEAPRRGRGSNKINRTGDGRQQQLACDRRRIQCRPLARCVHGRAGRLRPTAVQAARERRTDVNSENETRRRCRRRSKRFLMRPFHRGRRAGNSFLPRCFFHCPIAPGPSVRLCRTTRSCIGFTTQ